MTARMFIKCVEFLPFVRKFTGVQYLKIYSDCRIDASQFSRGFDTLRPCNVMLYESSFVVVVYLGRVGSIEPLFFIFNLYATNFTESHGFFAQYHSQALQNKV